MFDFNTFRKITLCTALFTALGFAGSAFAAGGHEGGHGDANIGQPGKTEDVSRSIEVKMEDIYFEPESIDVKPGETIRFVVTNTGEFVHEFNIGTPDMHTAHREEMAMMMEHGILEADKINRDKMKMDMGGGHTMEHDDPNSVLLEPGETAEVVWTFPKAQKLEFACNVPGHYESGMAGEFIFPTQQSSR